MLLKTMLTQEKEKPNKTQADRILRVLEDAAGRWVPGTYFLRELYISQYHARIFDLQRKGYDIEASDFSDEYGFKSYRLKFKETLF